MIIAGVTTCWSFVAHSAPHAINRIMKPIGCPALESTDTYLLHWVNPISLTLSLQNIFSRLSIMQGTRPTAKQVKNRRKKKRRLHKWLISDWAKGLHYAAEPTSQHPLAVSTKSTTTLLSRIVTAGQVGAEPESIAKATNSWHKVQLVRQLQSCWVKVP